MSTNLWDLSPIPLPDDKPSNRGRFSDDRQYWEDVHKRRYLQWQGVDSIEEIAAVEGVTYNAVKHSLMWCEARLPRTEVVAAHQTRLRLQAFARLSTRYLDELESLMSDPNPVIRSRALEHFRKTELKVKGSPYPSGPTRIGIFKRGWALSSLILEVLCQLRWGTGRPEEDLSETFPGERPNLRFFKEINH